MHNRFTEEFVAMDTKWYQLRYYKSSCFIALKPDSRERNRNESEKTEENKNTLPLPLTSYKDSRSSSAGSQYQLDAPVM